MQNSNYIQSPLANAMRQVYNQPVYNSYQAPQAPVQQQLTPEQLAYIQTQASQPVANPRAEQLAQNWHGGQVNFEGHPILSDFATIARNIPQDIGQIGTGIVHAGGQFIQHPIESTISGAKTVGNYLSDLGKRADTESVTGNQTLDKILSVDNAGIRMAQLAAKDAYNNFGAGFLPLLNTKTIGSVIEDLGKGKSDDAYKKLREAGVQSWEQFKQDPLITSLVVAPNATTGLIGKVGKGSLNLVEKTTGLPVGQVGQQMGKTIQAVEAKFNKQKYELDEMSKELTKANPKDIEIIIRGETEGTPIPDSLKGLQKKFDDFNEKYRATYDDNALVNPNELAALQYVQRQTGKTIQEIRRELTPQLEELQAGVTNPSLSFKNRLSDFEHEVNSFVKKDKEYLKDSKKISELSDNEALTLAKHFDPAEINVMKVTDMTVKDAKQYLADVTRDAWDIGKVSEAALKDVRFQENMGRLAQAAEATGDPMLKHLYDGMKLANEGKTRPYTYAGAKIPQGESVLNEGRRFAGKSSSREYGTATYEELANAYKNVHNFLDDVTAQRVKQEISNNIINNGTIDGVSKLVGDNIKAKDIRYLNPDLLAEGRLSEAITRASEKATDRAIAIDKYNLSALDSMLRPTGAPYKAGILGDVYNLFKESALASGIYLGGNLMSGVFGTLLNSGTPSGLIKDIVASIGSKGRLAKEMGAFRQIRPTDRRYTTKFAKGLSYVGRKLGTGIAPRIDAMMQNAFAEINANAALRKMGIPVTERESALANMNKTKLANTIENVRLNAMMNNKYRVIPRGELRDIVSIANPFLDWIDTSTQVSAKMLIDHPVLMGAVASKLFGEIAFDKELQNRLNLNVTTDKPLVTYIPDSKTGGAKEVSINFLPQLTPIEFLTNPSKLLTGTSGAPVLSAIYEASKGKTPYGNPMRRTNSNDSIKTIQGDARYRVNPDTHMLERITKSQGDEMLSTAIRNLVAPVNLWNKTVAPTLTDAWNAVTGEDRKYYMPYGQSIFGSWETGQPERGEWSRNIISTGDPRNKRNIGDILKGLGTYYERDYYPEDSLTGNQIRRIIRSGVRQNLRNYGEE